MTETDASALAVLAEELRAGGEEPSGKVADAHRVISQLRGYKTAYVDLQRQVGELRGYEKAYHQLNKEVGALRSRVPSMRSDEERRLGEGKPSILIASQPKSGTVFVGATLFRTLRYDYGRSLVLDGFPKNVVHGGVAKDLAAGGAISTSHIQGDEWNLEILKRYGLTKIVLMVRDPRAALFSWHNYYIEGEVFGRLDRGRHEAFSTLPVEQQLATHVNGFFKQSLHWISEWVDTIERDPSLNVLELRYEDMIGRETEYIETILNFYGLSGHPVVLAKKDKSTNFRTGVAEAWRSGIPPEVIETLNSQIPRRLMERYRWAL